MPGTACGGQRWAQSPRPRYIPVCEEAPMVVAAFGMIWRGRGSAKREPGFSYGDSRNLHACLIFGSSHSDLRCTLYTLPLPPKQGGLTLSEIMWMGYYLEARDRRTCYFHS